MKRVLLALAIATILPAAFAAAPRPAPDAKPITAQGCVQAGVEAGCLVVKDVKTGTLYNLLIKGPKPSIGLGIQFTGTPHDGPTMCMQGAAIDVQSWARKDGLECAQPAAPRN